jgi:hypothetical protein
MSSGTQYGHVVSFLIMMSKAVLVSFEIGGCCVEALNPVPLFGLLRILWVVDERAHSCK